MRKPFRHRLLLALVAFAMAAGAHAQTKEGTVELPIWNQASGKLEAILLLEPTNQLSVGARKRFSEGALDAAFGLGANDSLGLLCDRKSGVSSAIANLANHCLLASVGDEGSDNRRLNATAGFSRNGARVGVGAGVAQDTLPAWLSPQRGKVEQHDVTVFGEKNIGREGFVTIGGTVAKAKLVSAADVPELADRWNTRTLTVGGGYRNFSANIIGRVIDVPGQPTNWQGLGLGFTWRTPWSGQLTVGADNVVTRGKNPFAAPAGADDDTGTIPYVQYEQDL